MSDPACNLIPPVRPLCDRRSSRVDGDQVRSNVDLTVEDGENKTPLDEALEAQSRRVWGGILGAGDVLDVLGMEETRRQESGKTI